MQFSVLLQLILRSAEVDESAILSDTPVTKVKFEKPDTWCCSPNVGLSVEVPFGAVEVKRVFVGQRQAICELADLVTPQSRIETGLNDFKEKMLEAGWRVTYQRLSNHAGG